MSAATETKNVLKGGEWLIKESSPFETFTAENYACTLEQAIPVVLRANVIISAVDHFATILDRWSASPKLLGTPEILEPLSIFNTNTIV